MTATLAVPAADLLDRAAERTLAGDHVLMALEAAAIEQHPTDMAACIATLSAAVALLGTAPEIPDHGQTGPCGHLLDYDATHSRTDMAAVLTACANRARALQPTAAVTA